MGWIHRMDFLGNWHARNFSYGDRMVVPHTLLNPVDDLLLLPDISDIPFREGAHEGAPFFVP
jgi:hypothetical protein